MQWVEHGIASEEIIATKYVNEAVSLGVQRQRPFCPYPSQARNSGTGNPDLAEGWSCKSVYAVV